MIPWRFAELGVYTLLLMMNSTAARTTGYSTYLILGKIFIHLLPVGSIAYRVNLFSAVMGAVTLALVYRAGQYPEFVNAGYTLHPVQMGPTLMWQLQGAAYQ